MCSVVGIHTSHVDLPLQQMDLGNSVLFYLDAELRAEIGYGGGGNPDNERMKDEG